MIFDVLERRLIGANLATPGISLFRNAMPAETSIGIMTRVPLQGIERDQEMPGWIKTRYQVIIRHVDPIDGQKYALMAMRALSFEGEESFVLNDGMGSGVLRILHPETYPISFPRLEGNGYEWSIHLRTVYSLTSPFV